MSAITKMCYTNMNRGFEMKDKDAAKSSSPLDKNGQKEKEEFIDVFRYFENANIRNRDAFCELLDYTIENRRDPHK